MGSSASSPKASSGKVVITYWPLRGLGQQIHWLCEVGGIDYEVRHMNPTLWQTEKPSIELDYPNIPHILDGDFRMSESSAIMKYLSKKCGLAPKTNVEVANSDMAEGALGDLTSPFGRLIFSDNYDTEKLKYPEQYKAKLAVFEKVLSKRPYLAGDRLTWTDIVLYESLDVNSMFVPGVLDDFPKVQEFKARVDSLENVVAYRNSDRFKAWPVTGGPAKWGKVPGETIFSA